MAVTPSSWVYLLDTPLDNTYSNELHFTTVSAQRNYFNAHIKHKYDDVTYNRKDSVLSIAESIDSLIDSNYVMYCNAPLSNHWFYAFITKMEYVSDYVTNVYIETDVYQTWLFDVDIQKSFVIREHVSNDAIGSNLVDEGLDLGEYIMEDYRQTNLLNPLWYVVALSDVINDTDTVVRAVYGNVYSGVMYKAFSPTDVDGLTNLILAYTNAQVGKGDAIQFIFTIPKILLPSDIVSGAVIPSYSDFNTTEYSYPTFTGTLEEINKFRALNGHIPVNKKLMCYPFNYLYASNNNGQYATYRFEDFDNFEDSTGLTFQVMGNIAPSPTAVIAPENYRLNDLNNHLNMEHSLQITGFPLCSWSNDMFNAWLAQNATQTALTFVGGAVAVGAGIATANVVAVGGGAMAVFNQMAELNKAYIQPDQARGNTSGASVNVAYLMQDFFFSRMCLKKEYAERIDDYFSMYGYKVNKVKVPETHSRLNWNYIKTIDINITGSIPTEDMQKLKHIYDKGVTLWHNPSNFCHYEMDNSIR